MTMRQIPATVRADLEQPNGTNALLAFVEIRHENLPEPIRLVSDPVDYQWGGETYVGIVFEFRVLNDDDEAPYTELVVPNVDRKIGEAIRTARNRATVDLTVLSAFEFDQSVSPRVPIGQPAPVYAFSGFDLVEVQVDVAEVRGRLMLRDYATEPWPGISATQSRFPGLFR